MPNFFNYRFLQLSLLTSLIVLGIISKSSAQTGISPGQGTRGKNLTVIIGSNITFQQSSPTVCPNQLKVSTSNIVFQQGSTTIHPTSINTNNNTLEVTLDIPINASIGYYDILIGQGESCPLNLYSTFYIRDPYIMIYPESANKGENLSVHITGMDVDFHQGSPTVCPSHLNVNTSNVSFRQGSTTIYPSSVSVNNGQIDAQVSIPPYANGYYDVVINDANCSVISYQQFYINPAINVSPNYSYLGKTLDVTISGIGINLVQGSSTVCPSQLNVSTSNVFFKQGSSTIYPSSISINNNLLTAHVTIPMDASTDGWYDLIIGNEEDCSIVKNYAIGISKPYISGNLQSGFTGRSINVSIWGNDINFTQSSSTICPNLLHVTASNVVFQQGSYTIHPSDIIANYSDIYATLDIPSDAPTGYYNVIVGINEECSYNTNDILYLSNPTINIYPSIGAINQQLSVSIYGNGINFHQGSATVCPNDFDITISDVVFRLGATEIYPTSVSLSGGSIVADLQIPPDAPIGNYKVIIGENSGCPFSKLNAFNITQPTITAYGYSGGSSSLGLAIEGNGLSFTQESNTNCPFILNANNSNIYITDGTTILYPENVDINSSIIYCSFTLPSSMINENEFDLVVGEQTECPYSTQFIKYIENTSNSKISSETITKIYPNPSDGSQINLEITKQGTYEVTIINPYGEAIGTTTVNGPSKIALPEILSEKLNPGMYLININDGKKIQHEKLIIE